MLRENPAAKAIALPLRELLAGYDVDLIWFNSADAPYAPFGQLYADYEGSLRFTRSIDEIVARSRGRRFPRAAQGAAAGRGGRAGAATCG